MRLLISILFLINISCNSGGGNKQPALTDTSTTLDSQHLDYPLKKGADLDTLGSKAAHKKGVK